MKNIVWLASYPKSGNTWLRLFLANYLSGQAQPVPINKIDRFSTGDSVVNLYKSVIGANFDSGDDHASLLGREPVLRRLSENGADVNLVKTHNRNGRVQQVRLIPPQLTRRAIYILRNPLDMLVSYADHYGVDPTRAVREIADENNTVLPSTVTVRQFTGNWSKHVASWTGSTKFPVTVMRYEDILADPGKAFATVIRDIGAPVDQARVDAAIAAASFDEASKQEADQGFIERSPSSRRFFRSGRSGEGRAKLSPEIIDRVTTDHGDMMTKFGYLP